MPLLEHLMQKSLNLDLSHFPLTWSFQGARGLKLETVVLGEIPVEFKNLPGLDHLIVSSPTK